MADGDVVNRRCAGVRGYVDARRAGITKPLVIPANAGIHGRR